MLDIKSVGYLNGSMTAVVDTPAAHSPGEAPVPPKGVKRRGVLGYAAAIAASVAAGAGLDRALSSSGGRTDTITDPNGAEAKAAAAEIAAMKAAKKEADTLSQALNRRTGGLQDQGRAQARVVQGLVRDTGNSTEHVVVNYPIAFQTPGYYGRATFSTEGGGNEGAYNTMLWIEPFRGEPESTAPAPVEVTLDYGTLSPNLLVLGGFGGPGNNTFQVGTPLITK